MVLQETKNLRTGFPRKSTESRNSSKNLPIIAICHLSWDWVWQRPQQFLSRLAKTHPLLFVQTHCTDAPESFVRVRGTDSSPQTTILEIHLPSSRWHDGRFIDMERRELLQRALATDLKGDFDRAILWINDPMAVTAYAGQLNETMIVYDCMDELTQFAGAAPELVDREKELTELADVIFCGGRKMRDKRLPTNPNTHFYGTGVDCRHFGKAMDPLLPIHHEIAGLPGPVLGYFGVIDERIDYKLIERLADEDPSWSIAMIGPVTKVDPASLPQRPNIHWLGGRDYQDLPALTKGMDVCLMPFAINAATEYINPTKALEYMAAAKPVVATALDEVQSNFSIATGIADCHEEFIGLCRREAISPSRSRIKRGLKLASENTWEAIVCKMDAHIQDVFSTMIPPRFPSSAPVILSPVTEIPRAYV
jgi:glycosyltransferase involved in cell wall biosynthesis